MSDDLPGAVEMSNFLPAALTRRPVGLAGWPLPPVPFYASGPHSFSEFLFEPGDLFPRPAYYSQELFDNSSRPPHLSPNLYKDLPDCSEERAYRVAPGEKRSCSSHRDVGLLCKRLLHRHTSSELCRDQLDC